jgi:alanine-synthesizing transaminase
MRGAAATLRDTAAPGADMKPSTAKTVAPPSTVAPVRASDRSTRVTYAVRDVLLVAAEAKAAGRTMTYLNIGDPITEDFRTPEPILDAIAKALKDGKTSYAPSSGIPDAVEAIREQAGRQGITGIQEVFVTHGASEAIEIAIGALVNPGENLLVPSPGYPLYPAVCAKYDVRENPYYLSEENGWQPDPADIEARVDGKTRAIVLINPNNPTGSVCAKPALEAICAIARKHSLVIFADEIYDRLTFDGETHVSIASLAPDLPVITFNGLSKVYLGPGLRIGWGIVSGPKPVVGDWVEAIGRMTRARLCASHPAQVAIPVALRGDQSHVAATVARMQTRAAFAMEKLAAVPGITCVAPRGAFYAFPKLDLPAGWTDEAFVKKQIRDTGVVTVHGSGFGQRPGTHHMRLVLLPPEASLARGIEGIAATMAAVRGGASAR